MRAALWVAAALLVGAIALSSGRVEAQAPMAPPEFVEPTFQVSEQEPEFAPGRIIVKLEEEATDQDLERINNRNDASVEENLPAPDTSVVDLPRGLEVEEAAERYEFSPDVEYAEPDFLISPAAAPDDPDYPKLYGLNNTGQTGGTEGADIDAPAAWEITQGNPDTLVAVIDTGVDINHSDLKGNIWVNEGEVPNNGKDDDNNGYVDDVNGWDFWNEDNTVYDAGDGDEHGTHVAGTIAAEGNNNAGVIGVNWRADIMPLKFLGPNGGYTSDAVKAIDYAVKNGAKISNNSWGGGGYSQSLKDAIARADAAGHLFVAAAGNAGTDNDVTPSYPASYDNPNIISVAATTDTDVRASFSNYGAKSVDLAAPGVRIRSTLPAGNYGAYSGTSMATPHVAGAAALLKSKFPTLDDGEMKTRILRSAEGLVGLQGTMTTSGRLNAARALGIKLTDTSLSASRSALDYGQATALSGRLTAYGTPIAGEQVILEQRPVGASSFRQVSGGETTTASDGTFRFTGTKPIKHTDYRARFSGNRSELLRGSTSPANRVNVRVITTLNTATKDLKLGKSRAIRGMVKPKHGSAVTVAIKRNGSLIARKKVSLNQYSRYAFTFKPGRPGRYTFFATYPKHADHLGDRSPQKSFKVVR